MAVGQGDMPALPAEALTTLFAAAFDRAALEIESGGGQVEVYRQALEGRIGGLFRR